MKSFIAGALSCTFLLTAFPSPTDAATINLFGNQDLNSQDTIDTSAHYSDRTVYILMDASDSMDVEERLLIINGLNSALDNPNVQNSLNSGDHVQFVLIPFATSAAMPLRAVVNNTNAAKAFFQDALFKDNSEIPRQYKTPEGYKIGASTNLDAGLDIVLKDLNSMRFPSHHIEIIALADEPPSDKNQALETIARIKIKFPAKFHCVDIERYNEDISAFTDDFYTKRFVSKKRDGFDSDGYDREIGQGLCLRAQTPASVTAVIKHALIPAGG